MNSQQVVDLKLLYEAVYDDGLREKVEEYNNDVYDEDIVEVATEYFYNYGLNEDGIDIFIDKVGLETFVEFVYELSEDLLVLSEARSARRRTGGPSYEEVKAKIDAKESAKKKAKKAAQERKESESKKPQTRGADTEAKREQPKSKKPIRDAIARQVLSGMERHRKAMELAKETGKTLGKAASVAREAGHRATEHVKKHGLKSLANEEFEQDNFDYLLEYLVAEGYADTNQDALVMMANMTPEEVDSFLLERRREEKGTPRKPRDRAFELVAKSMGTSRMGVKPRGEKKVPGKKPPAAGEYGSERRSPAQQVAMRRAAAQRSQEAQSSRFD